MLRELGSVFSFLTIIPTCARGHSDKNDSANQVESTLEIIARHMYLFPLVGLAIGLVIGFVGYGLSLFLDPLIVGLVVAASIALITGVHHTDGLADFSDGLMTKGAKEKKLSAMKDVSTGSAGIVSIVLYVVGLVVAVSLIEGFELFVALVASEVVAKFSMVLVAGISKSASVGSNSPFIDMMRDKKKILLSGIFCVIPVFLIGSHYGMFAFGAGIAVTLLLALVAHRSFGGVTGDVMGATNELTRLACLLFFASV